MKDQSTGNSPTDFLDFEWFLPAPRKSEFVITVNNTKSFNLNQRLCSKIWKQIQIGITSDGKTLCLKEKPENGFFVPKSGSIKDSVLINEIKSRGISLPARYIAERKGDYWFATIVPAVTSPAQLKKTPKKPRKNGLKCILLQEGN